MEPLKVEIWSDVVCPWCYIGKRRFEAALAEFEHHDQVEVHWRSYQLDPQASSISELTLNEMLAQKYALSLQKAHAMNEQVSSLAAAEGLAYHLDQAHPANTFDAHRLIHLADTHGLQDAMKERLMRAYFTEGQTVGDRETLVALGVEVGLDGEEIRTALASEEYARDVDADIALAQAIGVTGVPFFVVNQQYGISGAQPKAVFHRALKQVWTETHPLMSLGETDASTGSCTDESCAI